jgi:hypothetical protein
MSGLEVAIGVAGAVVGLVQGFQSAVDLWRSFRDWRRKRNGRDLEASLVRGSSEVQDTYSQDLRRLGPRFAAGDGTASTNS